MEDTMAEETCLNTYSGMTGTWNVTSNAPITVINPSTTVRGMPYNTALPLSLYARPVSLPFSSNLSQSPPAPQGLLQSINVAVSQNTKTKEVKSMPIHLIVEQIQGGGGATSESPENGRTEISPDKLTPPTHAGRGCNSPVIEMDTYAILPGTTMFCELVRTALIKIGYTSSEALGAKGSIQIKKWKPLSFDTITDNPNVTLDEVLGDMTSIATLRIRLCRSVAKFTKFGISQEKLNYFRSLDILSPGFEWTDELVRCAVIDLLNSMTQSTLARLSPLAQSMISNIANSKYIAQIGSDKCSEFGTWYTNYKIEQAENESRSLEDKTRLTFHPIYELPKMRDWFTKFVNPTDELLISLVDELNNSSTRQQRKQVTLPKLKIWWRNERVRQKRILGRIKRGEEVIKSGRGRRSTNRHQSENIEFDSQPIVSFNQNDESNSSEIMLENLSPPGGNNSSSTEMQASPWKQKDVEHTEYPRTYVQLQDRMTPLFPRDEQDPDHSRPSGQYTQYPMLHPSQQ